MLMIDRRYFRYFDWFSFFITLLLLGLGLLFVFSSTYRPEKPISVFFKKQAIGAALGLIIYFFFCIKDLRKLARWGCWIYFVVLALLVYTMVGGWVGMGGKRWISLYFLRFQPSELAKLFFPFFIAYYLEDIDFLINSKTRYLPTSQFMVPLIVLLVSFVLILKQPDLGTALLVLLSGFVIFWFIGINREFFLTLALVGMLGAPLFWNILKPYQQQRILVLFGYGDAHKERYQVEQSKIAIGSGGVIGKGLLKGTQNKFDFLPEDHTDFIFSVICEEFGFLGAMLILLLFFLMFTRMVFIISQIPSLFEQIVGVGLLIHILLSVCINIGMVAGLLPTVGIPLPLFSYGLSNLWITLASLGGLNNIAIRRFYY
jgi:rod shape determining protein RodA